MPLFADRVRESSTTTGTGTITLLGTSTGFRTFAAGIGVNNFCFYAIVHQSANEWEIGYGAVLAGPSRLNRTNSLSSSNGNALVNFSAGTKDVFVTIPANLFLALQGVNVALGQIILDMGGQSFQITNGGITVAEVIQAFGNASHILGNNGADVWLKVSGNTGDNRIELHLPGTGTKPNGSILKLKDNTTGELEWGGGLSADDFQAVENSFLAVIGTYENLITIIPDAGHTILTGTTEVIMRGTNHDHTRFISGKKFVHWSLNSGLITIEGIDDIVTDRMTGSGFDIDVGATWRIKAEDATLKIQVQGVDGETWHWKAAATSHWMFWDI